MHKYKAAIFDMDGTVLDTLGDLSDAMNAVMKKTGHRHDFTLKESKEFFGSGVEVAIRRALSLEAGAPISSLEAVGTEKEVIPDIVKNNPDETDRVQKAFRAYYSAHCDIKTGPYDGIVQAITALKDAGILTAVVSNKPDNAVKKLCADYFPDMFITYGGQREDIRRKPAPDMTLKCLEELGINKEEAVYIGDSEIDMQTAANTGMDCICVSWGFRSKEFLIAHGAATIADSAEDILKFIL